MRNILIVVILTLVTAATGYFAYSRIQSGNGNGNGALVLYGNVDIREVPLAFRVGGRLQAMNFEEGDAVREGDLLALLDDEPLRHNVAMAEADAEQAGARLKLLRHGSRPQEIRRARAGVEEAAAGLENAQHEFNRQQQLVSKQHGSQHLLDQARASRDQWTARLTAAREALALAEEGFRNEEITAAQAVLGAAAARRDRARLQLRDTRLYAPSGGVIMTRIVEPGAMLGAGAPVYSLSLTERVYVRAYVDEPNLGLVVPGAGMQVHTDGGRSYLGQVGFVSPRAEFTPKSVETPALRTDLVYRLRIVVTDADQHLRQGMPVTVRAMPGHDRGD